MKVIHFNDFESYAGAETAIKMLRESHEKLGLQTFLYTKKEIGSHLTPLAIKKIKCQKVLKKIKPDCIHIHNTTLIDLAPAFAAIQEKIPIVWTLHDYRGICPNTLLLKPNNTVCKDLDCPSCDKEKMVIPFKYKQFHSLLRNSKCVVASNHVKKRHKTIVDAERIYWDADNHLLKLKANSSFDSKDILFAGRRDYEKGTVYAIAALKRIVKRYPNARLLFAGEARAENTRQLAKIYGVEKNVVDLGYLPREKYLQILQNVNCVICPSVWEEPFNLSLLEAMAAGKPAIATRVGGQTEVLGKAGILIEPKSSIEISNAIQLLFSSKKKARELGRNARERASKFKDCGKRYKKVYEKAIA